MDLSPRTASRVTAAALAGMGAFQAGLAAGAPWGPFAYGGTHPGRLPTTHRQVSAGAAVGYIAGAIFIAVRRGDPVVQRRVLTGVTGFMAVGAALNLASRSRAERLWSPVCAATALTAWRARDGFPARSRTLRPERIR
ncbi:hypothetical protein [Gordonia rhizosphera]|nr:hypothetical protein [Gordonia rhizosphera]